MKEGRREVLKLGALTVASLLETGCNLWSSGALPAPTDRITETPEKRGEITETPEATEEKTPETPVIPEAPAVVPESGEQKQRTAWVPYESEGGIPYSGSEWNVDVAPDEIEVLTAGPATVAGVHLPGGVERGSVIVLLPSEEEVVSYQVTDLVAGANWHGSYRPVGNPGEEETWRSLAEDRVEAMKRAPNCTEGIGCATIDVLIVQPGDDGPQVVKQWVVDQE